jgi:hypothetical protein
LIKKLIVKKDNPKARPHLSNAIMEVAKNNLKEFELQADTALDKAEFFKLVIEELNNAYDGALSTRETVDLINRVGGTIND